MSDIEQITSIDLWEIENKLDQLEENLLQIIEMIRENIDEIKKRPKFKLLTSDKASEFIGVQKRQLFNLADNPKVKIWRYNKDGSRKTTNRPTAVRFNFTELLEHKKERERRKRRNR